jgi:hypothetical protein
LASESGYCAFVVGAKRSDDIAVTLRQCGKRVCADFQIFERRECGEKMFNQRSGDSEFVIADRFARVAWVQVITRRAEGFERVR